MSENQVLPTGTQNDRIMAALAHVTVILPMMGVIAPIVIWVTQKEKSESIAFQALQAVVYQLTLILIGFVGMACYMCSFFGIFIFMIPFSTGDAPNGFPIEALGVFFPFLIMAALMFVGLIYIIYGLVGAVQVLRGKDFRYILIGRWLERYLSANTAQNSL